jgi:hypothetical protein
MDRQHTGQATYRQHNGQATYWTGNILVKKKKDKWTNNDLQNITRETKD